MKLFFLFFSLATLIEVTNSSAQEIDFNKVILPKNVGEISNEERLVQLAWQNNPNNDVFRKTVEVSRIEKRIAKWNWLDYFSARFNVNEFTLNPSADIYGRAAYYPKYNFSAVIPFSTLATNGLVVKQKALQLGISESKLNSQKLAIRAEILTLYTKYQLAKEKLTLQQDTEQEILANYRLIEEKFKKGAETVGSYNNILERYTTQRIRTMEADADVKLLKISIEEIIGVKLESVITN